MHARRFCCWLSVAAVGLLLAPAAQACDAGRHAGALGHPSHHGRAPLEIGDSTSIIAAPILARLGIEADARGCRQFGQAIGILRARRHANALPHVVVLALGANGPIAAGQMAAVLGVLGPGRILALVTALHSAASDAVIHRTARAHPDRVLLIDWVRHSAGHAGWFGGDGLHVGQVGAQAYARLIRRSIAPFAFPPRARLRLPSHSDGATNCGAVRRGRRTLGVFILQGRPSILCRRARSLVRSPPLRPIERWEVYDWRPTVDGPWRWIYERGDHKVIVGATG